MGKVFLYTAHKMLWDMLVDEPLMTKSLGVEYLWEAGIISLRELQEVRRYSFCFACLYADFTCWECPLDFEHTYSICLSGLFLKWKKSVNIYKKRACRCCNYNDNVLLKLEDMIQLYAKRIRDLPVREGVEWR